MMDVSAKQILCAVNIKVIFACIQTQTALLGSTVHS